jgi:molecular chaperone DnaJ
MDLYQLLGVRRSASVAEIRRAFQKAARQLHPDLNPGDPVAANRYRVVSEPSKCSSTPSAAPPTTAGRRGRVSPRSRRSGSRIRFLGRGPGGQRRLPGHLRRRPRAKREAAREGAHRGEDLEESVRITFDESFHPTRRRLHVVRLDRCEACAGSGGAGHRSRGLPRLRGYRAGAVASRPHDLQPPLRRVRRVGLPQRPHLRPLHRARAGSCRAIGWKSSCRRE